VSTLKRKTSFYLYLLAACVNFIAAFLFLASIGAIPKIAGLLFFASFCVHLIRAIKLKKSEKQN
jgi:Ca2+/Na+ antiporter